MRYALARSRSYELEHCAVPMLRFDYIYSSCIRDSAYDSQIAESFIVEHLKHFSSLSNLWIVYTNSTSCWFETAKDFVSRYKKNIEKQRLDAKKK